MSLYVLLLKLMFYGQTKYISMANKLVKRENKVRKEKGKKYYLKEKENEEIKRMREKESYLNSILAAP